MYLIRGESDRSLIRAAEEHAIAVRKIDQGFTIDETLFSPRFAAFFQNVVSGR